MLNKQIFFAILIISARLSIHWSFFRFNWLNRQYWGFKKRLNNFANHLKPFAIFLKQLNSAAKNFSKRGKVKRTLSYLQTRLEITEPLFKELSELNITIMSSSNDEAVEYLESDTYEEAEDVYINLKWE